MDTPQIFPQQTVGLPKGQKMDMGRWVLKGAHERPNEPSDTWYYLLEGAKEISTKFSLLSS